MASPPLKGLPKLSLSLSMGYRIVKASAIADPGRSPPQPTCTLHRDADRGSPQGSSATTGIPTWRATHARHTSTSRSRRGCSLASLCSHLPAGRVSLEEVLRLAVKHLGVEPRRDDWDDVPETTTQGIYEAWRTWPRTAPARPSQPKAQRGHRLRSIGSPRRGSPCGSSGGRTNDTTIPS